MKKIIMPIAAFALVAGYAGAASAACDFDVVAKAKGMKSSMIRAYAGCPSTETPSVNTETNGGTPACEPVTPRGKVSGSGGSSYNFSPKGGCSVQTSGKLVADCSTVENPATGNPVGLPPQACHVVYVKAKCKGILQDDFDTPINAIDDAGWSLATLSRASLADQDNGDMTVIDFPVTFQFGDPNNGSISLSDNSAAALYDLVGTGAALPTCTQIGIVDISIKDPDGWVFATLGGGSATSEEALDPGQD